MLQFKALATVFRELRAPELEAAQAELEAAHAEVAKLKEKLALVNTLLDDADHEIRSSYTDVKRRSDEASKLRRQVLHLKHENEAITKRLDDLMTSALERPRENEELREKLNKRRKKDSTNTAA